RYTVSTLQQAAPPTPNKPDSATQDEDEKEEDGFRAVRERLLSSGRLFVERAAQARTLIAETARRFVKPGATVLTAGGSRAVAAALDAAAEAGTGFRVVYVRSSPPPPSPSSSAPHDARDHDEETMTMARRLRGKPAVEVAIVRPESVAYCLGHVTAVMVGAEGVLENGGVVSAMGILQLAVLARSARKPFYVLAESHKFVRLYPLGQYDLPVRQTVLEFQGAADRGGEAGLAEGKGKGGGGGQEEEEEEEEAAVDYTPPDLVTALVTEVGVLTPSAVSEELIKIWY
ncbi:MAG: hypothetical protein LQ348_005701, partial [Seirophora lacunosa]